jgi:hypothetical protein
MVKVREFAVLAIFAIWTSHRGVVAGVRVVDHRQLRSFTSSNPLRGRNEGIPLFGELTCRAANSQFPMLDDRQCPVGCYCMLRRWRWRAFAKGERGWGGGGGRGGLWGHVLQ